ncbi:MAG: polysulfide reductase NrfD, partial [Acidobacteriaceae bacterium]|nr:polysulfide reductase NrfD [Acidobacteriaceae bacterium]
MLIHDLGRPERFLNMLRVFRITSPMSVGSWILTVFSSAAG